MKLLMQGLCVVALMIVVVGLALHLSAGNLSTSSALAHDELATGLVSIGDKVAIIIALIIGLYAGQRADWRWVGALGVFALVTLLAGPLGALTNTGDALFFIAPIIVALIALAYTFRMHGSLAPDRAWWRAPQR
jgi:hypothetical protein